MAATAAFHARRLAGFIQRVPTSSSAASARCSHTSVGSAAFGAARSSRCRSSRLLASEPLGVREFVFCKGGAGRRPFCVAVQAPAQDGFPEGSCDTALLRAAAQHILADPALAERLAATSAAAELLKHCGPVLSQPVPEQAEEVVPAPTAEQMKLYFLTNFIPFVGFGFCDNAIMILAGDYIDAKLGLAFGITTMAAAGLGNTLSDVVGLWISGFIEAISAACGLRPHGITLKQMDLLNIRILKNTSMIVGIVLGCMLGMFPLIYPQEWRIWPSRRNLEVNAAKQHDFMHTLSP